MRKSFAEVQPRPNTRKVIIRQENAKQNQKTHSERNLDLGCVFQERQDTAAWKILNPSEAK